MRIQTVLGDISPQDLGITTCHEHLIWQVPEPYRGDDPDLGFDSVEKAIVEVKRFTVMGGRSLVEMTTSDIGRSPNELKEISIKAGVQVIAATGHHKEKFSKENLSGRSLDQIAERIILDLTSGMDGTDIKAGVIKAATSLNKATDSERLVIQAVGLAHKSTGAPVSTHTEEGSFAFEQIQLLIKAGVPPERMLIGHLDRNLPRNVYHQIAQAGVYMGFDQIGKEKYWPDTQRVLLIKDMIEAGYLKKILLSSDSARKSSWNSYNSSSEGLAHILMGFSERLLASVIREKDIHTILVDNPASLFAF